MNREEALKEVVKWSEWPNRAECPEGWAWSHVVGQETGVELFNPYFCPITRYDWEVVRRAAYLDQMAATEQPVQLDETDEPDMVNRPQHYAQGGVECIEAIKASMTVEAFHGYIKGNVMKYLWRYEKKVNPVEDLKKAMWYLTRLCEERSNANS